VALGVWAVIALLILLNALYVAAEFGAVGVRRSRLRRLSEDGSVWARRLLPHVEHPAALDRYVAASQVGITLSSLLLGAFAQATIAVALAPRLVGLAGLEADSAYSIAAVAVLLVLTGAQVVLGELVPKSVALQFPTQVALATVLPMRWSMAAFRPLIALLNGSATALLRAVGVRATSHRHIHSPAEIDLLIAESRDGGLLEPDEHRRLHRALRLSLRTARDLMVPLDRVTMIEAGTSWEAMVRIVTASPYSRLPVHRGARHDVIGTLRVKDLVHHLAAGGTEQPIERLMRPIPSLGDDLAADRVLALLRDRRAHQGVVAAAGRVVGLVTIQDVLTEFLDVDAAGTVRRA
jgi:CBS domain containing-hemolysin-like protein